MLRLVERDYAATSAAGQIERTLAHVFLRMNRQLYRNVEIGKRLRNEATGQPASVADADVQSCTHCPDCGYRQMTSSRVCPECGWTNDAADVVLFGRNGPQASGSALRRNRRSLRARWSVIVLLGGHVLVFVLTAFASTKLQNSPLLPSLYLLLVAIVFLLASTWGLAWFLRSIESKAEKEERAINVAEGPAGEIVLRLQAAGFAQHLVGRRGVPLQAYDKGSRWRVTRWPGGLRVRCDRVGVRPGKRNENRPVDFVCNAAEPRAAVQEIRRRLGILLA
jgi:rubredoxin